MDHGTVTKYRRHGCRCKECCRANTEAMRAYRQQRGLPGREFQPAKHGSSSKYARGCRCGPCTVAHRESHRKVKATRMKRAEAGLLPVPHGTNGYVNYGCRCDECRFSWSAYIRRRKAAS